METNLLHVVLQLLLEALHGVVEVFDLLPQVEVLSGQSGGSYACHDTTRHDTTHDTLV